MDKYNMQALGGDAVCSWSMFVTMFNISSTAKV